jgi:drug/metabolite transporter superfamily protein YnfA
MKLNKSFHIYGLFGRTLSKKGGIVFLFLLAYQVVQSQGETAPDFIRSIGKIYVVAGVCLVILLTLLVYLVLLDRKISKFEKRHKNE